MNLPTIEMPRARAREAFLQYRRAVREEGHSEDEAIMRGYRALAAGHQVLDLPRAIREGGEQLITIVTRDWQDRRRVAERRGVRVPRLAAAQADAEWCWTRGISTSGSVEMRIFREESSHQRRRGRLIAHGFPSSDEYSEDSAWWNLRIRAAVPLVPPALRPRHHLRNYTILWEAEWGIEPDPPRDPALLKPLGGDLYAVVAVWDLTELERAVLGARTVE